MNKTSLTTYIAITGCVIIGTYFIIPDIFNIEYETLWAGIENRHIYYVSMIAAAISFLIVAYLTVYYYDPNKDGASPATSTYQDDVKEYNKQTMIYSLILIPSAFWMLFTCMYFKYRNNVFKFLTMVCLILTTTGSVLLNFYMSKKPVDKYYYHYWLGLIASIIFTFQVGGLDLLVWGFGNFMHK
tara:strand:- start:186 stop:740 length:555 start_codon:yes stop_codon:yes gene_type:complete